MKIIQSIINMLAGYDVEDKIKVSQQQIQTLVNRIEETESKLNDLRTSYAELENRCETLSTLNMQKQDVILSLSNENTRLSYKYEEERTRNNELVHSNESYRNELSSANNQLEDLQEQKRILSERVMSLEEEKNQLNNQLSSSITNASNNDDELRELERQNQLLEEKLADKSRELEISNCEIRNREERIKSLESALTDARDSICELNEKNQSLEECNEALSQHLEIQQQTINANNKTIEELNKKVADTETAVVESDIPIAMPALCQSQDDAKSESIIVTKHKEKVRKSKVEDAIELSDGSIEDFPVIMNDSNRQVKRTIEYVRDQHDNIIYADEFFNRSAEEISQVARKLVEAEIKGELYWTCGLCRTRVKIAHRLYHGTESLFFIHAKRECDCPWVKPAIKSDDKNNEASLYVEEDADDEGMSECMLGNAQDETNIDAYKPNSRILKEKIVSLLLTRESQDMGISNVAMDKIVNSNIPYMKWRRPDICFDYKGRKMVIELQKKSQTLTTIVDKDVFYRLTDNHVVWIFGSDSDTSYDYMRQSNYKNTMFDNHRNVLVFDKEAQEESERRNVLLLKCNWLEPDDEWSVRVKNSGTNGKLIALTDLIFDDEYCKPYHYDANEPYFQLHPEARDAYLKTKVSREELLKSLEEKWTRDPNYEDAQNQMRIHGLKAAPFKSNNLWGFRFNTTTLMQPVFSVEPKLLSNGYYVVNQDGKLGILDRYAQKVIDWSDTFKYEDMEYDKDNQRLFIKERGCWGATDIKGNILIKPDYQQISPWSKNICRVKKNKKWGLCSVDNQLVTECIYESIDIPNNGKAKASKVNPLNVVQILTGHLDMEGHEIFTQKIEQPDGLFIVQQFECWGIVDSNNSMIAQTLYEDVQPWSGSLYRVKKNHKWGILNANAKDWLLEMKYDYIGELSDGVARVVYAGMESHVDAAGKEVHQAMIELQSGLLKTKKSGKWGIVNKDGVEIVAHKYDEIGSFRGRLVGVINGRIIKLDAYYEYPLFISGKYLEQTGKKICFDVYGVRCVLPVSFVSQSGMTVNQLCNHAGFCEKLAFANLIYSTQQYHLRLLKKEQLVKKFSNQGDKKDDFADGEIVAGTIVSYAYKKKNEVRYISRLNVSFADGRKTKVTRKHCLDSKQNINNYQINDSITLKKKGFDDELDQTIWEII